MLFEVVSRLRAQCPLLRSVEAAAAAVPAPAQTPYAWVLPIAETASRPMLIGLHAQRLELRVAVELVVREAGDASGAAVWSRMQDARAQVRAALAGWRPDGADDSVAPLWFALGRLLDWQSGQATVRDEFAYECDLRA